MNVLGTSDHDTALSFSRFQGILVVASCVGWDPRLLENDAFTDTF